MFRPKHGSGFVVLWYRRTRYLVINTKGNRNSHQLRNWCILCLAFFHCMFYFFHSSLVIGMLLCLVGHKECGLVTQCLGPGWPLSEARAGLDKKSTCTISQNLIIQVCLPGPETESTTHGKTGRRPFTMLILLWNMNNAPTENLATTSADQTLVSPSPMPIPHNSKSWSSWTTTSATFPLWSTIKKMFSNSL